MGHFLIKPDSLVLVLVSIQSDIFISIPPFKGIFGFS